MSIREEFLQDLTVTTTVILTRYTPQIRGYGMMRVYEREDNVHIHQELNMAPGTVHDKMYDSKGLYPWHEYKSVTPCVYCPIEIDR